METPDYSQSNDQTLMDLYNVLHKYSFEELNHELGYLTEELPTIKTSYEEYEKREESLKKKWRSEILRVNINKRKLTIEEKSVIWKHFLKYGKPTKYYAQRFKKPTDSIRKFIDMKMKERKPITKNVPSNKLKIEVSSETKAYKNSRLFAKDSGFKTVAACVSSFNNRIAYNNRLNEYMNQLKQVG